MFRMERLPWHAVAACELPHRLSIGESDEFDKPVPLSNSSRARRFPPPHRYSEATTSRCADPTDSPRPTGPRPPVPTR